MRRTTWILLIALILSAIPAMAADKTVGVIVSGNIAFYQEIQKAFAGAFIERGYDYRKVDVLMQMPSPDPLSWTNAARKLSVAEVNVLITYGAPAALASIRETRSIPIVYAGVYDPVAVGVAARNTTGISSKVPMTSLLKYLKRLVPFFKIAVVYSEQEPDSVRQAEELTRLESRYGFQTVRMPVRKTSDVKNLSFAGKADAVLISVCSVANEALDDIVKAAREAKIPTISQLGGTADHGVVLTLSPSAQEQGEAVARLTARILEGAKPVQIPPEFPKLVELVLNLREVKALGLKAPIDLITDATRVIK